MTNKLETVNKPELIALISEKSGFTKKDTEAFLASTLDAIQELVSQNKKVQLVGFGGFEPRERAEREGKNPKTQEPLHIDATVVPVFKAGSSFKKIVKDALVK